MPVFEKKSVMPAPAAAVFQWHGRPGAFERLVPPWQRITVVERSGGIREGARLTMVIRNGPVAVRWEARHSGYREGREFTDEQVSGPFKSWRHTHRFIAQSGSSSVLHDHIEYAPRLGPAGKLLMGGYTARLIERMFRFRHAQTSRDLVRLRAFAGQGPRRIAISGASGMIGTALGHFLEAGGHRVERMVRRAPRPGCAEVHWDPERGEIDAGALDGVDAVVHLSGESVAGGRWTRERREKIVKSRADSTRLLCETLARLAVKPRVLISASAIGYYGDCAEEAVCDEGREAGRGFLAEVCRQWEDATAPARKAGIRVVNLRIGVVLAARGGALNRMLPPFSLGFGGRIGTGKQIMSWVALDDVVGAIHHLIFTAVSGPVNLAAPESVTNAQFAAALGQVLHRPALLPLPAPLIRALFGRMGEEMLLYGARVEPKKLLDSGFAFSLPDLAYALREELGRED
ncbi:MAG TPA: TIGR01777 family oxidoreductase [bacterium]|nr:TIGR01777 family oxidoreductase [bacterium]